MKGAIKSLLSFLGYDVRNRAFHHVDAWEDQRRLLRGEPRVILDIGANVGQTVRRYRSVFPKAMIHCFEPTPEAYAQLSSSVGGDARVRLHREAVSDRVGNRKYFLNRDSVTNSLLENATTSDRSMLPTQTAHVDHRDVASTTVDEFCRRQGLAEVDVLKMDIQGAELLALQGATGLLQRGAIGLIYTEVLFAKMYEGQAGFGDISAFLERMEYPLYGLYNLQRGRDGMLSFADAIFVNRAIEHTLWPSAPAESQA